MARAIWEDMVIAESDETLIVEGNHFFPPDSVHREYFAESSKHTTCPWKGLASYYDVKVGGQVNRAAAWFYPSPEPAASKIANYVAFWRGVKVES
jgi:uncharacterized protein (DUF427 family)